MALIDRLLITAVLVAAVCALRNGVGLKPPLGWSTWCVDGHCGRDYCNEAEVMQAATAMQRNGLYAAGYEWVLLDDCWAATSRTAAGALTWDSSRFPSGIPALVVWLHKQGFKFGLYTSAGNQTCSPGGRPGTVPGSEHHYQQDADTFASWAVDYVKIDWCGDVKKMPFDGIAVGAKDYKNFSHALTHTTPPRDMYIEGVAAYLFLAGTAGEYVNAWRATMIDDHDTWRRTISIIAAVQFTSTPGRPGAWSYMDVIMTGGQGCRDGRLGSHCPGQTDVEYRTEFTVWALTQSPLIVATDVRNMTSIMTEVLLNKRMLAIHQDTATPPGRFLGGDSACHLGILRCQLWSRVLSGGEVWVVLLNAGREASTITFDFSLMAHGLPHGWGANTTVTATDMWAPSHNATSAHTGAYAAVVPPHGVSSVLLSKAGDVPHRTISFE